ncbi:MAG: PAS domain-containing protein [Campylobacterota bacterium]|nr:PAS domain-containing protein [Campylobacterota bacterium]
MNLPIELFKKKEHLYAFFNHMTEMVVITNAKDGTIVYINKSLSDTFLYSKDELIGKKYDIFWLGMIDSDIYKSVKSK